MLQAEITSGSGGQMDPRDRGAEPTLAARREWFPLRDHRIAIGLYESGDDGVQRTHQVEVDVTGAHGGTGIGRPCSPGPALLLTDDDLTFAKIRLDERSLATVTEHFGDVSDPPARALLWGATWDNDPRRRNEAPVVPRCAGRWHRARDRSGLWSSRSRQADSAVALYAPQRIVSAMPDRMVALLSDFIPGAARQRPPVGAYVRGLISFARRDEHVALLKGLLAGTTTIDGLAVDTTCGGHCCADWSCSARPVATRSTPLEQQLRRHRRWSPQQPPGSGDHRGEGRRWDVPACTRHCPTTCSVRSSAASPSRTTRDLLRPHVEQYFESLPEIWRDRTTRSLRRSR